jgi:N-acyl-D-amino-acid deacylase
VQFASEKRPPGVLREFLQHPLAMPSSDTFALPAEPPRDRPPTPIAYGLFPSYVNTFVNVEGVLSLEEAIRKATSLPAERFGLQDRGILRTGAYADVVVFDLGDIEMCGDFLEPARAPGGIVYVFVNGRLVHRDGQHTGARPGMVLRRS